jgi:DNA replication protein DnaC
VSCGKSFEATIIEVRGEAVVNEECSRCRPRGPLFEQPGVGARPPLSREALWSALETLGVNVRRHGHVQLHELQHAEARARLEAFATEVVQAGRWAETRSLYLWGPTGTGKSQAAVAAIRALIVAGMPPRRMVYDRGRALVTQLQDRYTTGHVDEFSEARRTALLWVYEDAGTEKLTPDSFRVLEDILDRREGCPTIITTNLSREDFSQRWSVVTGWERLRSRLGPYVAVEFKGMDRRLG